MNCINVERRDTIEKALLMRHTNKPLQDVWKEISRIINLNDVQLLEEYHEYCKPQQP